MSALSLRKKTLPLITLSLQHDRSEAASRQQLERVVQQMQDQFGGWVRKTSWSHDRKEVRLDGRGFWIEMAVDDVLFHITGDIPLLANLFGGGISTGIQRIVESTFHKQLR